MQIQIDVVIQLIANAAILAWYAGRLNTKIAIMQTEIGYIKREISKGKTMPASLGVA